MTYQAGLSDDQQDDPLVQLLERIADGVERLEGKKAVDYTANFVDLFERQDKLATRINTLAEAIKTSQQTTATALADAKTSANKVGLVINAAEMISTAAKDSRSLLLWIGPLGLILSLLAGYAGWHLKTWVAPEPGEVMTTYLARGNDAKWLLCEGDAARKAMRSDGRQTCQLVFWAEEKKP